MKIFKSFKTKKQLQKENEELKARLLIPLQIHRDERHIEKVQSSIEVGFKEREIPEDAIKMQIAKNMLEFLQPLITYDFKNNKNGGKTYCGKLYVVNKKKY